MPCCPLTCPFNFRCISLMVTCNRGCDVDLPPIVPLDRASISGPLIIDYMNLDWGGIFEPVTLEATGPAWLELLLPCAENASEAEAT